MSPTPSKINEPLLNYAPGSAERVAIQQKIKEFKSVEITIPMIINGKEVFTDTHIRIAPPHEHAHTLGYFC